MDLILDQQILYAANNSLRVYPRKSVVFRSEHTVGICFVMSIFFLPGLTLELYLEQNEYLPELTESAGIRMSITPQSIMPFPQDDSTLVSPGEVTFIGLTMVWKNYVQPSSIHISQKH